MMKKWIILILCAAVIFGLAACGRRGGSGETAVSNMSEATNINETTAANINETASANVNESESSEDKTTEAAPSPQMDSSAEAYVHGDSDILVAYFSLSGNVQQMAEWISGETGGDIFRIVPAEMYSKDFEACSERAKNELDNGIRPELAAHIEKDFMAQYDTIFIGFPVWWYDLPMPVWTFLEEYDLSDKTIVPFFSHNGSANGANSLGRITELAKDADVWEDVAMPVQGSRVANAEKDVKEWAAYCADGNNRPKFTANKQNTTSKDSRLITKQILSGADGIIRYSYCLPENYDEGKSYPMMVIMPGRDKMWFGEKSAGSNVNWRGFMAWTDLEEDMIVVSAQLTDWGEKSARQSIELTEYFLANFPVNADRVYASGYSAGGETMSQAVAMRPDLYAAYLHCASKWDGTYAPVAKDGKMAVYIFMAENDEAYGSKRAWEAYDGLRDAYRDLGWSDERIAKVLKIETPNNEYFNKHGIYNYHGGVSILFDDKSILEWIMGQHK